MTEESHKVQEKRKIKKALKICKYPDWALCANANTTPTDHTEEPQASKDERRKQMIVLPYVGGLSEKLHRVFKKHQATLCSKPAQTIRQVLVHPKDKVHPLYKCGTVYCIECDECEGKYIGESGRTLATRITDHNKSIEKGDSKSALSQHNIETGHAITCLSPEVLTQESHLPSRKIAEAIQIRIKKPSLNRDQGLDLPRIYDTVLKRGASRNNARFPPDRATGAATQRE